MISAEQIRAGRALIGVKQSELAKAAGIALATLNNIERGIGDPRASTLEAIERTLAQAGVTTESDGTVETVNLVRRARPSAHDTYFASQRVLEALAPDSLTKVRRIMVYARWARHLPEGEDPHRICFLLEGGARSLLFDQVDFNIGNVARAAEVAGIMLAAMALYRDAVFYLDAVIEDTTVASLEEALTRLGSLNWTPLTHPREFFDVFDDWEGRVARFGERAGHPMRDLIALAEGRTGDPERRLIPDDADFSQPPAKGPD